MQDSNGIYYYPVLTNKKIRMYVRQGQTEIEFRLWDQDDISLWNEHGWVPWGAVKAAAEMYEEEGRKGSPPLALYDIEVAKRLLKDHDGGKLH